MRNSAFLIITALILAIGGYQFFGKTDEDNAGGSLTLEKRTEAAAAGSRDGAADLPDSDTANATESVAATSDRTEVESAAAPAAEPEIAEKFIQGRVVNSLGSAVVGAKVRIGHDDGTEFARAFTQEVATLDVWVSTDTRGIFRLPSERRGVVTFEVNCPGYAPLRVEQSVAAGDPGQVGDLVIEQGVRLAGHVVDESGTGIAGATIRRGHVDSGGFQIRFSGSAQKLLATTGPSGEFEVDELMAGPYALEIDHEQHPRLRTEGSTKRPGDTVVDLKFTLEDGHSIAGVVREIPAGEHEAYRVRALPGRDVQNAVGDENFFADPDMAEIDQQGMFVLTGLRAGSYRLQVIDADEPNAGFANGKSASVDATTGDADVELALREPLGVTFRVVDAVTGKACTTYGASVGDTLFGNPFVPETEHEDGRTTVESVDLRGDNSRADIRVTAAGYSPAVLENVELMPGVVKDIGVIRLDPVPVVTIEVLDAATGEPIQGARVNLSEMVEDTLGSGRRMSFSMGGSDGDADDGPGLSDVLGGRTNRGKTDENGMAELASLPGKRGQVSVTHRKYADAELLDLDLPTTGTETYTVHMSKGGTVTVTVYDAEGNLAKGVRVKETLVGDDAPVIIGGSPGRKTKADGTVVFKNLVAGTHNFKISESDGGGTFSTGGARMVIMGGSEDDADPGEDIVVTEGSESEVTLHKKPEGSLTGKLTEGGEALAGATLEFKTKNGGEGMGFAMPRMPGFGGGKQAKTNGSGAFTMEGLKVGLYTITVTHPERIMPMEYDVEILAGENKAQYDLPIAILEGQVRDVDGEPVAGIDVTPKRYRSSSEGQPTRMVMTMVSSGGGGGAVTMSTGPAEGSVRTDENGRYTLRGVTPDVDLVVETSSDKYQEAQSDKVSCAEGQTRTGVDLTVEAAGGVRVTILNPDGSPGEYCIVTLDYADETEVMPDQKREFTGETGIATARGLRPGFWRISGATVPMGPNSGGSDPRTTLTDEVEIIAGETVELTLELD